MPDLNSLAGALLAQQAANQGVVTLNEALLFGIPDLNPPAGWAKLLSETLGIDNDPLALVIGNIPAGAIPAQPGQTLSFTGTVSFLNIDGMAAMISFSFADDDLQIIVQTALPADWTFPDSFPNLDGDPLFENYFAGGDATAFVIYASNNQAATNLVYWNWSLQQIASAAGDDVMTLENGLNFVGSCSYPPLIDTFINYVCGNTTHKAGSVTIAGTIRPEKTFGPSDWPLPEISLRASLLTDSFSLFKISVQNLTIGVSLALFEEEGVTHCFPQFYLETDVTVDSETLSLQAAIVEGSPLIQLIVQPEQALTLGDVIDDLAGGNPWDASKVPPLLSKLFSDLTSLSLKGFALDLAVTATPAAIALRFYGQTQGTFSFPSPISTVFPTVPTIYFSWTILDPFSASPPPVSTVLFEASTTVNDVSGEFYLSFGEGS